MVDGYPNAQATYSWEYICWCQFDRKLRGAPELGCTNRNFLILPEMSAT